MANSFSFGDITVIVHNINFKCGNHTYGSFTIYKYYIKTFHFKYKLKHINFVITVEKLDIYIILVKPITSSGVICVHKEYNLNKYLIICRKDTLVI